MQTLLTLHHSEHRHLRLALFPDVEPSEEQQSYQPLSLDLPVILQRKLGRYH